MLQKMFIISLFLFLSGCGASSVAHLDSNPLSFDENEQLSMRHWEFEYLSTLANDYYLLQGKALLLYENLPFTREWLHDLRLTVYLSDDQGAVLARDSQIYHTRRMRPGIEVPFSFQLDAGLIPAATDIFVAFGYSMWISEHRFLGGRHARPLTGDTDAFQIRQGPLLR